MSSNRRLNVVGILVCFLLISSGGYLLLTYQPNLDPENGNTTSMTDPYEDFVSIEEIVAASFKEIGFGEAPGENSSIEATVKALELLSEFDLIDSPSIQDILNLTYEATIARHAGDGGFHPTVDDWETDLRITALSVKILRLLNRLDEGMILSVTRYLTNYLGSLLRLENWLSSSIFDYKYWALRCVIEFDVPNNLRKIGLYELSLDNVYSAGEDPGMDTGRPILWDYEIYFPYQFTPRPLAQRLLILESFEYMIPNPLLRPYIISLLVNSSDTINELVEMYDSSNGLVNNSLEFTWMTYRTLTNTGRMTRVFDSNETSLNQIQGQINSVIDFETARADPQASIFEILLLTKIANILTFNLNHGFIEEGESVLYCCLSVEFVYVTYEQSKDPFESENVRQIA